MSELVVARGDASEILEPAETALDDVAVPIGLLVVPDTLFAVGFARDDRLDLVVFEESSERIGVITFVGQKFLDAGDQADAFLRHDTVGSVARREDQHPRPEVRIDDRVDFPVAAALGEPNRLKFGPPFPPLAQR